MPMTTHKKTLPNKKIVCVLVSIVIGALSISYSTHAQNHPYSGGASSVISFDLFFQEYQRSFNNRLSTGSEATIRIGNDRGDIFFERKVKFPIIPEGREAVPYNPFSSPSATPTIEDIRFVNVEKAVYIEAIKEYIIYLKSEIERIIKEQSQPNTSAQREVQSRNNTLTGDSSSTTIQTTTPGIENKKQRREF